MKKSYSVVLTSLVLVSALHSIAVNAASQEPQQSKVDYSDWGGAFTQEQGDKLWKRLSHSYFGEREIVEGELQNIIQIKVPSRAENDALVPVQIDTNLPQEFGKKIKKIYLTVDINPTPMAAKFTLSPNRSLESISTRVRVNGYTYIRAIAEMNDGQLFMDKKWVKSRGAGCSAPPGTDQETAKTNLGKMRFKFIKNDQDSEGQSKLVQLMISHPNNTGMQRDQLSTFLIRQQYVKEVEVKFNEERILKAETTFSISENPSFRFSFEPSESGELVAHMIDTDNKEFYLYQKIKASE